MTHATISLRRAVLWCTLTALAFASATTARAERADRDKPVNIEAERMTYDDLRQVNIFEGRVVLTQGTLTILADRITVRQDAEGFQHGTADRGPDGFAYFRQKREGVDEIVQGWGERIEYDAKGEKADMIGRARFLRGADEVRGSTIRYDGRTEFYSVNGAGATPGAPGGADGRVRAVIQPRSGSLAPTPAKSGDLTLKSTGGIVAPRPSYPEPPTK
jgi:lipopolysaccharide export system protein LptA